MSEPTSSQNETDASPAPPRRSYRLHFSTYLVHFVVLAGVVLANVPGDWHRFADKKGQVSDHGWPWVYLHRSTRSAGRTGNWLSVWDLTSNVQRFNALLLLADLTTGLAIVAVSAACFEWWRRRRSHLFQFRVRDMLIVFLMIAIMLGWAKVRIDRYRKSQQVIVAARRGFCRIIHDPWIPDWLRSLLERLELNGTGDGMSNLSPANRYGDFTFWDDITTIYYLNDKSRGAYGIGSTIKLTWISDLPQLPKLKRLHIHSSGLTDERVSELSGIKSVNSLDLIGSFTDDGLTFLSKMRHLRRLALNSSNVSNAIMPAIGKMNELEYLSLINTPVTDSGLAHIARLTNLESLVLSRTSITDDGLIHLSQLSNLRKLMLDRGDWIGDSFRHLANLTELESFIFDPVRVHDEHLRHLTKLKNLAVLRLKGQQITDAGLVHVRTMTGLKHLDLNKTLISDDGLRHIADLRNLKFLILSQAQITGDGLRYLARLDELINLDLSVTPVTDDNLVHLAELSSLDTVYLTRTQISDTGLMHLSTIPNVRWIVVAETAVTPAGIKRFQAKRPDVNIQNPK